MQAREDGLTGGNDGRSGSVPGRSRGAAGVRRTRVSRLPACPACQFIHYGLEGAGILFGRQAEQVLGGGEGKAHAAQPLALGQGGVWHRDRGIHLHARDMGEGRLNRVQKARDIFRGRLTTGSMLRLGDGSFWINRAARIVLARLRLAPVGQQDGQACCTYPEA